MPKKVVDVRLTSSVIIPNNDSFWYVQGKRDGLWGLPAGKIILSPLENFYQAAKRESEEELGVSVFVYPNPVGFYQFISSRGHPVFNFTFRGLIRPDINPRITRPMEISEIKNFTLEQIERLHKKRTLRAGKANIQMIYDYIGGNEISDKLIHYFNNK